MTKLSDEYFIFEEFEEEETNSKKVVKYLQIIVVITLTISLVVGFTGYFIFKPFLSPKVSMEECERVAAAGQSSYDAPGWEIKCVDIIRINHEGYDNVEVSGLADPNERTITLSTRTRSIEGTLAHELGHAWAADKFDEETRLAFSRELGFDSWVGASYEQSPVEMWASGFAKCHGYKDYSLSTPAPCELIIKYMEKTKNV